MPFPKPVYEEADTWGSHLEVLEKIFKVWTPEFVLEFGLGKYSTPFFRSKNVKLVSVESDPKWIQMYDHEIIHLNVDGLTYNKLESSLTAEQRKSIIDQLLKIQVPQCPNLLFIDGDASTRVMTFSVLAAKFDVVVAHDTQPFNPYGYERLPEPDYRFMKCEVETAVWSKIKLW